MPMDKSRYPSNWPEISLRIRERAGQKCEQCGVPNGLEVLRSTIDPARYLILGEDGIHRTRQGESVRLSEIPTEYDEAKYVKIVLTVHHIGASMPDGTFSDPEDKLDCRDENLIALCQRCHFLADARARKHIQASYSRRTGKKPSPGQLTLF
jgi:hypothetical protein